MPKRTGNVLVDNSSTTPLANGESFTGAWTVVEDVEAVNIAVKADQDGIYSIQFSPDGINPDSTLTRYYRTNQIEAPHRFAVTRRYCRVVFTNDSGSDQTVFRLQTMVGGQSLLNAPVDGLLSQDFDSISVRPSEFKYEVATGLRQGYETWNKWGYNDDIDAGPETIWSAGGLLQPLTNAEFLDVTSTSGNDWASGTGARAVIIYGVDENYEPQIETVTLNGTFVVTTNNTWLGVNRVAVTSAGTTGYNEGTINVDAVTSLTTQAQIPLGEGSTQQAFFFVPAKHQILLDWLYVNVVKTGGGGNPLLTLKCWVTSLVSGARYQVFRTLLDTQRGDHQELRPSHPFQIGEKSLVTFEGTTDTANTSVSLRFSFIQVRDADARI